MDFEESISNQTDNSLSLARDVLSEPSNIVFSPLSIHVLLGMIAAGAKGPTRDQILGFLINSTSADKLTSFFSQIVNHVLADGSGLGGPVLSTANGLWVDRSLILKPDFRHLLDVVYAAVSKRVDFQRKPKAAVKKVNKWCSKETNGLIKNIVSPDEVDPLITRLILANAVYFKGAWSLKFDKSITKDYDFHLLDGSSVRAPLMSSRKSQYFRAFHGFKVLRLPYEHGEDTRRFSMCIFLPDAKDGLPALRDRICSESGFINSHLPRQKQNLDKLRVPKFKISYDFEASDVLKKQGLVLPFEGGEVTEMVEQPAFPLEVSKILQKSFIEVNEEGTEAAAVSAAHRVAGCSRFPVKREPVVFIADHPFLFVIREDNTGVVLFVGQLLNPLAADT